MQDDRGILSRGLRVLLACCLGLILAGTFGLDTRAQNAAGRADRTADPAALARPYADTLRALVVFVKFRDDDDPGDPNLDFRGWPLYDDPTRLPSFAGDLLAPAPHPPFPEHTLTEYFHRQSLGRFVVYGDVYGSVVVSRHREDRYHRPRGGYGHLTKEVLDRIDAAGFDFSRYDHNGDGRLDHLFIILRRDSERDRKRFTWTGISCLDATCGGGMAGGRPGAELVYDGVAVDWADSGSYILHTTPGNILPSIYHVRLMAHELGHDLWSPFFTHIRGLADNDVPVSDSRKRKSNPVGYVLMAGAGGGPDARGDEIISAFERDLLGWIRCEPLVASQDDVIVTDLYTTSDCKKVTLHDEKRRVLYFTNRQRLGYFDRYRRGGRNDRFEMGLLRTTGLLVLLAERTRVEVIPADNTLALSSKNAAYEGDLFSPDTQRQLTPWTRPNISGYTRYPRGHVPSWQAIDNIRYLDAPGKPMAFNYVEDFRLRPVIRSDSWIGEETRGQTFDVPFLVTNGATLHVDTNLTFSDNLRVEPGATIIIGPTGHVRVSRFGRVELAGDATLRVEGTLEIEGQILRDPTSTVVRGAGGIIRSRSE